MENGVPIRKVMITSKTDKESSFEKSKLLTGVATVLIFWMMGNTTASIKPVIKSRFLILETKSGIYSAFMAFHSDLKLAPFR